MVWYHVHMVTMINQRGWDYPSKFEFLSQLAGKRPTSIWRKIVDKNQEKGFCIGLFGEYDHAMEEAHKEKLVADLMEEEGGWIMHRKERGDVPAVIEIVREVMVKAKAAGLRLGVATSSEKAKAEGFLNAHGLLEYFEMRLYGDDPVYKARFAAR